MHTSTPPTTKALREFAYTLAIAFPVVFCLLLPWLFNYAIPYWPLAISGILLLQAWLHPPSLAPVQKLWMALTGILGWINTRIILGLVFFLLITPIGWIQRRRHKLHYHPNVIPEADSYKIRRSQPLSPTDLENPF
ncbi:SxtJ family membrane protein [Cellvibrio japonicus]|uniref:Putative membrane protein n=1 Tax=Cellvibrio japonicus (strain Ueda107) TaxID=498211 RepID=B3PKX5_CELJU|nr:SxtJ family membrane protein [Cellvibrio japonicus]ACE83145.1 putative membrane protein [Cellvibrio japonicus Ueda107]QEI12878.1 hypothetical protein FY117_12005 [Cellvibrio japonicus]QEI16452.1 hypothetical protein FY116_12010 [Cellvibrio japonicus]QEI20030.1 hypothetical protein FY115_12005 [Cellvibrio japonicus]